MIISSFKTNAQILSSPFTLPTSISFDAYAYLFTKYNFLGYALNSPDRFGGIHFCVPSVLRYGGLM